MDVHVVLLRGAPADSRQLHRRQVAEGGKLTAIEPYRWREQIVPITEHAELHASDQAEEGALRILMDVDREPERLNIGEKRSGWNRVRREPIEIVGPAMTEVEGESGSAGEIRSPARSGLA